MKHAFDDIPHNPTRAERICAWVVFAGIAGVVVLTVWRG